jgi:hypothetical protein
MTPTEEQHMLGSFSEISRYIELLLALVIQQDAADQWLIYGS